MRAESASSSSHVVSAMRPQLRRVTQRDRAGLVPAHEVLRVVEPGTGEPLRAGHRRDPSTRSGCAEKRTSKNSASAPQKPSRSSTDHRQSAP